jgi:hypothetical protein
VIQYSAYGSKFGSGTYFYFDNVLIYYTEGVISPHLSTGDAGEDILAVYILKDKKFVLRKGMIRWTDDLLELLAGTIGSHYDEPNTAA